MVGLVWMVFIFGQILESVFLTPVLIGDKIGLHSVMVIFSLMAGGVDSGFVGLLVAIPIAAIVMVFTPPNCNIFKVISTKINDLRKKPE